MKCTFISEQDKRIKPLQPDFCPELTNFIFWLIMSKSGVLSICNSNVFKYIFKKISYFMESEEMLEIQAVVFQCHWSSKFCLLLFIFTPDLMNI